MTIEKSLDAIHAFVVKNIWLQRFTVFNRLILAVGFVPPSLIKIFNQRFTALPDSNPVGHYFNALYETGFYYQFIGWAQLTAALLLLFPRTAHIGAMLFLPIILNIAVLTTSVDFAGTKFITAAMFLACLYLFCWDYDLWKSLLFERKNAKPTRKPTYILVTTFLFAVLGGAIFGVAALLKIANLHKDLLFGMPVITVAGAIFGFGFALHHSKMSPKIFD